MNEEERSRYDLRNLFDVLDGKTKEPIIESVVAPEFNPVRCYSIKDLADLMGTSVANVKNWLAVGLIRGIETGKSTVFPIPEIQRFQDEMLGCNISNLAMATRTSRQRTERK